MKRFLSLCAVCVACSGSSSDLPSGETTNPAAPYRAAIKAVASAGFTTVTVELFDGNSFEAPTLVLANSDTLSVRADGREVQFQREEGEFEGRGYVAVLTGDQPGTQLEIALDSDELGEAAATLRLPDRFTITAPGSDASLDLSEPIELVWKDGKAGDRAEAQYEISCATGGFGSGVGSHGEDRGEEALEVRTKDMEGPCSVVLGVERQVFGEMSGVWGGHAVAAQRKTQGYSDVEL